MTSEERSKEQFEGWAILELMGHRRLAGYLREQEIAGQGFLRIDVPKKNGGPEEYVATQLYSPSAVYCITPTSETVARAVAASSQPEPVHRWELPAPEGTVALPECSYCGNRHSLNAECEGDDNRRRSRAKGGSLGSWRCGLR